MDKIKEYFKTPAISNSLLGLMWNPRWVKLKQDNPDLEDSDVSYFRIGSALDCLLTSPERWTIDFKVVDAIRPYGLMGKFIDNLPGGLNPFSENSLYQEAYDKSGYKMSLDRVIKKLWETEDSFKYYEATRDVADDVTIISKDEYDIVIKCKELILANEFIRPYFERSNELVEILHQVPIYFTLEEENCKALLDGIRINHLDRTIEPFDLKTSKSVYDFQSSFLQYGYYRQCAFYQYALTTENSPTRKYLDAGYTMKNFVFIVVENKISSSHPAIIYEVDPSDMLCGWIGGTVRGKKYKGIIELLNEYKFHRDNDYWDLSKELLEQKGKITMKIFD